MRSFASNKQQSPSQASCCVVYPVVWILDHGSMDNHHPNTPLCMQCTESFSSTQEQKQTVDQPLSAGAVHILMDMWTLRSIGLDTQITIGRAGAGSQCSDMCRVISWGVISEIQVPSGISNQDPQLLVPWPCSCDSKGVSQQAIQSHLGRALLRPWLP